MKMALLIAFALLFLGVVSGLAWMRAKNKGKKTDLVAKSNHKSVWSFHYGPASVLPIREMSKVSPRAAADSLLTQLIPEDLEAREHQEKAEEAARVEKAQALAKEGRPQLNAQPDEAVLLLGKQQGRRPTLLHQLLKMTLKKRRRRRSCFPLVTRRAPRLTCWICWAPMRQRSPRLKLLRPLKGSR
jgi:hypothetical protein